MGDPRTRYPSLRAAATADIGRAITMATCGALLFAPIEYALTLWTYSGPVGIASKLRLVALTFTFTLALSLLVVLVVVGAMVATRLARSTFDRESGRRVGWFVPSSPVDGVRPGVPRLWATAATLGALGAIVQRGTIWANRYQEPELRGIVIALIAIVAAAVAIPLGRLFATASQIAAAAMAPVLKRYNPLGRWIPAGIAGAALVAGTLAACWFVLPQSRSGLPTREACAAVMFAAGMGVGALVHSRRLRRATSISWRRRRRRSAGLLIAAGSGALVVASLYSWGTDPVAKWAAGTASPVFERVIRWIRIANDIDRDGYGSLLGENDCEPLDSKIYPGAKDVPDDNIDQNCDGRDYSLVPTPVPTGPVLPIPDKFKRDDWNILLITIDTVRYDHTSFGGYKDGPKKRDTTPRLAKLVEQSASFTFCNAPSAGTMASIPAILTSKYFHSGLALDENLPPGTPPKIKPENTTLPEIMRRVGYHTGVIGTHNYWNDWGLDQGVDDYDNAIGKTAEPMMVAADRTTNHALAWISRNQGRKWFLWMHYIDPHGRYVAHPDVVDYGGTEPDLYDAELKWTDQELGRLLDELARLPSSKQTIIIITSDHGESMGEHSVPVGTHGTALYRELLHVPMIFYVPNNPPRKIGGAVTNLDIVPTVAELVHADTRDLSFEGKSLVPQIFYGKEDRERIVFAETNAPSPQRAAISLTSKLIYYLHSNLYELYDLTADPWEKTNLVQKNPPSLAFMKSALNSWLERVVYSRDPKFNQANKTLGDIVLTQPPTVEVTTPGQTLDDGKLVLLGISVATKSPRPAANTRVDIEVYFKVTARTNIAYRFLLAAWPVDKATYKPTDDAPATMVRSPMRATGDGFFASDRWRPAEYVRDKFSLTIPSDWVGTGLAVGLVASDPAGDKAFATGSAPANDPNLVVLGVLPFQGSSGKP